MVGWLARASRRSEVGAPNRQVPVLDTVVAAETPEGILLELHPAGLPVRVYAFILDWLIRLGILYGIDIVVHFLGEFGVGFWLVTVFVMEWFYPVVFELTRSGATPGKKRFGLKVVMDNGLPITPAASFTRNLLRVADFMPFGYGLAIVSMLLRRDFKRLGDLAAATLVVHQPQPQRRATMAKVEPVPPVTALAPRDQLALMALAARAPTLSGERLNELAALAAAVCGLKGQRGAAVTHRVLGVSQWLMGRRA